METNNKNLLTAIIPVSSLRNDDDQILSWTTTPDALVFDLIFVFDNVNPSEKLRKAISALPNTHILIGDFGGPGPARNQGLLLADSEFICFWDSDDLPNLIGALNAVKELKASHVDAAIGEYELQIINDKDSKSGIKLVNHNQNFILSLTKSPGLWRFIFRASTLEHTVFPDIPMGEDQVFLSRYFQVKRSIHVLDYSLYRYIRNGQKQLTTSQESINRLIESTRLITADAKNHHHENYSLAYALVLKQILTILRRCDLRFKMQSLGIFLSVFLAKPFLTMFILLKYLPKIRHEDSQRIYVALNGGLGNQLFQISAAINNRNGRQIVLHSSIGYPRTNEKGMLSISTLDFPAYIVFSEQPRKHLISKIANAQLRSGLQKKHKHLKVLPSKFGSFIESIYLKERVKVVINSGVGWSNNNFDKEKSILLIGYFQSYLNQDSETLGVLCKTLLSVKGSELDELIRVSVEEQPLVVHVRLGDYKNEPNFGIPSAAYYKSAIEKIFNHKVHKRIWLFSDDVSEAVLLIPKELNEITRVIGTVDGSDLHTLAAMMHGVDYVIGNSTFSWWAARLSISGEPRVAFPSPWFSGMDSPFELTPRDWTPIPADYEHS